MGHSAANEGWSETGGESRLRTTLKKYKGIVLAKTLIWRALGLIKFFYIQRARGFQIDGDPYFESDAAIDWFRTKLLQSNSYLEYGSGGSTYLAAKLRTPFVTVCSDRYFLKDLKKKIAGAGLYDETSQTYIHANIGLTRQWGHPLVFGRVSKRKRDLFSRYSDFPTAQSAGDRVPDLILVDDRFRVACALKAIKQLKALHNWTLVVDDYADRPEYHVIETFAKLDCYVGRMAVFSNALRSQDGDLDQTIKKYEHDPR